MSLVRYPGVSAFAMLATTSFCRAATRSMYLSNCCDSASNIHPCLRQPGCHTHLSQRVTQRVPTGRPDSALSFLTLSPKPEWGVSNTGPRPLLCDATGMPVSFRRPSRRRSRFGTCSSGWRSANSVDWLPPSLSRNRNFPARGARSLGGVYNPKGDPARAIWCARFSGGTANRDRYAVSACRSASRRAGAA